MQLLTTKFKNTPEFIEWQAKLVTCVKRLHPARKAEFTHEDMLELVKLNNIFFYLEKARQVEFIDIMNKLNARFSENGRITASPTEAMMVFEWVVAVSDLVGEFSLAAFKRAVANHDNYTGDFKRKRLKKVKTKRKGRY